MKRVLLLALPLVFATPAMAQESEPGATRMTDAALLTAQPCFESITRDDYTRQYDECIAASDKLRGVWHDGMTRHEVNVYYAMKAAVLTAAGAAQAKGQGARTEASCATMEKAWDSATFIDVSRSPSRGQEMWQIRQQTLAAARACREDFGMPPGGAILPGS